MLLLDLYAAKDPKRFGRAAVRWDGRLERERRNKLGDDGWPHFPLVCDRLLNGKTSIPLTFVAFDVLEHER